MKDRIRLIMEQTKLSQQDFAARLGVSPASLSSIFTGRTNPTNNHVQAIHRAFPKVNVNWLLFGEGDMYNASPTSSVADGGHAVSETGDAAAERPFEGEHTDVASPASPRADASRMPSMFAPEAFDAAAEARQAGTVIGQASRTHYDRRPANYPPYSASQKSVNIIDKPERRIKEIRVFYDDGTYEAFVPSSK